MCKNKINLPLTLHISVADMIAVSFCSSVRNLCCGRRPAVVNERQQSLSKFRPFREEPGGRLLFESSLYAITFPIVSHQLTLSINRSSSDLDALLGSVSRSVTCVVQNVTGSRPYPTYYFLPVAFTLYCMSSLS